MGTPQAIGQIGNTHLVPLGEAAGRHHEVGMKAANLAAVKAAGFPVPDGVVLTVDALGRALDGLPDDATAPEPLERWLHEALEWLGSGPVAVRSSALSEDRGDASYAGQYETVLGVEGVEAVAGAVRHCWRSASTARVRAYERRGSPGTPRMAVLIQRLVVADVAGVAFTANPVTGARGETLVSAVRGLGDQLVAGAVTPDEWIVRGDRAERHHLAAEVIDADTARAVAALAGAVEAVLGTPQDVEWALAGDALFVIQARPITALPLPPEQAEPVAVAVPVEVPRGFWEREATHFPLPLSPMTRSLSLADQNRALAQAFAEHGVLAEGVEFREIGGWVYTRVVPPGGKEGPNPPGPLMWLLVRLHPQLASRVSKARRAIREDLAGEIIRMWYEQTRPDLQRRIQQLRGVPLGALDDPALLVHWADVRSLLADGISWHFRLHVPIALARYELARTCRDLLSWDESRAFELLSGLSVMSTAPALALARLAALATARPAVLELVERADPHAVSLLPGADPEFDAAFQEYQRDYAIRARRYEVAEPTLAEMPELTLATLRDQIRRDYDGGGRAGTLASRRSVLAAEARELLGTRDEVHRARFERVLARAEAAHPVHEENEFFTISVPLALVRYAVLEIGRRLVARGIVPNPHDVFFLEPPEALAAIADGRGVGELVARRKGERDWVMGHPGPGSYGHKPAQPALNVLPPESRTVLEAVLWAVDLIFAAKQSAQRQPADAATVTGIAASPGRYTGVVRIVAGEHEFGKIEAGDVVVSPITSPVWSVLFSRIGALVTDTGGILSHPAIIAREYRIPAVVATGNATALLHDGQRVTVDGDAGVVRTDLG